MTDRAFLLGINNYKSISDLRGCVNDVRNVKKLLVDKFGFDGTDNIRLLTNEDVILQNVQDGFAWLLDGLKKGDRAVFHFSGHGSYVPSKNDDEPTDELLCLWDMDWGDCNSYLIDDDLGKLTEALPDGAHLTVILDNCNSGTGTKAISGGRSFQPVDEVSSAVRLVIESDTIRSAPPSERQKSRSLFADSEASFRPGPSNLVVFARFIYPPKSILAKVNSDNIRSLGKRLVEMQLNHTLLTGARADQTAADAFIDGGFQGAFSYYLCSTSRRLGLTVAVSDLMKEVRASIGSAGYSQIPQLEGVGRHQRLFGGKADPTASYGDDSSAPTDEPLRSDSPQITSLGYSIDRIEMVSRLIDMQDRFLALSASVLSGGTDTSATPTGITTSRSGTKVVVYVHGISRHVAGYSDSWFDAMRPHIARTIQKREVLWSDLVNPRSSDGSQERALSAEAAEFMDVLRIQLKTRQEQLFDHLPITADKRNTSQLDRGGGLELDDFARYMTSRATRNAILQRFDQVVRPLLASGNTVYVIAHSWGTVVAYEGLRNMDTENFPGVVEHLIVAGSALSIGVVQSNLFSRVVDGRLPNQVRQFSNLDAGGDVVGGPIKGAFVVSDEHVGLTPVGCRTIPFTNMAINPACAHRSYFRTDNVAVNRDLFAKWINL